MQGEVRLKTRLCKFFERGACHRGEGCTFAHGEAELEQLPRRAPHSGKGKGRAARATAAGRAVEGGRAGRDTVAKVAGRVAQPTPHSGKGKGHAALATAAGHAVEGGRASRAAVAKVAGRAAQPTGAAQPKARSAAAVRRKKKVKIAGAAKKEKNPSRPRSRPKRRPDYAQGKPWQKIFGRDRRGKKYPLVCKKAYRLPDGMNLLKKDFRRRKKGQKPKKGRKYKKGRKPKASLQSKHQLHRRPLYMDRFLGRLFQAPPASRRQRQKLVLEVGAGDGSFARAFVSTHLMFRPQQDVRYMATFHAPAGAKEVARVKPVHAAGPLLLGDLLEHKFGVDLLQEHSTAAIPDGSVRLLLCNNPLHKGEGPDAFFAERNRHLLERYFQLAQRVLEPGRSFAHVMLSNSAQFSHWRVGSIARRMGLELVRMGGLDRHSFPGYKTVHGDGSEDRYMKDPVVCLFRRPKPVSSAAGETSLREQRRGLAVARVGRATDEARAGRKNERERRTKYLSAQAVHT